MHSDGLKLNIVFTLTLLLAAGMLMVNFVMIIFWQRDLIRSEVRVAQNVLPVISYQIQQQGLADFNQSREKEKFAALIRQTDSLCGAVYHDNRFILMADSPVCSHEEVRDLLKDVQESGLDGKKTFGSMWGVLSPGKRYLAVATPVSSINDSSMSGSLCVVFSLSSVYRNIQDSQEIIFVYIIVNVLILVVIGLFRFVNLTVKPLESLVRLTDSYSEKDGVPFFISREGNEFGQLSGALNKMMLRIEEDRKELLQTVSSLQDANRKLQKTQREMVHAEKLASVGRLAAGLAHEIGNPLSIVQGYVDLMGQEHLAREEREDFALRAESELQRISVLIRQMLDLARSSAGKPRIIHAQAILEELVEVVQAQPMLSNIKIVNKGSIGSDQVWCDPDQLRQVFLNCLINAADAITTAGNEQQGLIEIETETVPGENGTSQKSNYLIRIKDNGIGISSEKIDMIFDPFFTTKEPGKGTGLGLFVSHSIVERFGGRMWAESLTGEGCTMVISLPLQQEIIEDIL
jgi:hypothetical protein